MFIDFDLKKNFLTIFNFLFLWLRIKESNYLLFKRGLCLYMGYVIVLAKCSKGYVYSWGYVYSGLKSMYFQLLQTPQPQSQYLSLIFYSNSRKEPGFRVDMGTEIKKELFAKNQLTNLPDIHLNTSGQHDISYCARKSRIN